MTPKQERFVQEYLLDLNATQAAIRAGYSFASKSQGGYYVYFLCDSRNGRIFYVGKGKGDRLQQHVRGRFRIQGNGVKNERIRTVLQNGGHIKELIFIDALEEETAFKYERYLIETFKDYGLTNIVSGLVTSREAIRANAAQLLSRLKPYPVWAATLSNDLKIEIEHIFGSPLNIYKWMTQGIKELMSYE